MRFLLILLACLLSVPLLKAQTFSGVVVDGATGEPLSDASITNTRTGNRTHSDSKGQYTLEAVSKDTLLFRLLGYKDKRLAALPALVQKIFLEKSNIAIDTVVISGLSRYQRDSIERRSAYARKLDEKPAKVRIPRRDKKYGSDGPGAGTFRVEAPISGLVQKRTKKYKRLKAFQERFRKDEDQLFIDTRYTPELVQEVTALSGDSLTLFMNSYPMSISYARMASDVEISMWVRNNYKEWKRIKARH